MKFIKKRLPVQVTFARAPGEMVTLEGKVSYEQGDALMTGSAGEHWPISREKFQMTYEPAAPLRMGDDGPYVKKPLPVEAQQMITENVVLLEGKRGELQAKPGDWIVTAPDGAQWVVAGDIFTETYMPIDEQRGNQ